jgi:hypothetical protein
MFVPTRGYGYEQAQTVVVFLRLADRVSARALGQGISRLLAGVALWKQGRCAVAHWRLESAMTDADTIARKDIERLYDQLETCVIALRLLRDGAVCPKDKDARIFAGDTLAQLKLRRAERRDG